MTRLVHSNPMSVCHIPEALNYLVTSDLIMATGKIELNYMLIWAKVSPVQALSFFSRKYPYHPIPVQFAVRSLNQYKPDVIMRFIPQLVQAVRFDSVS